MLFPYVQSSLLIALILFPHRHQTPSPSYLKQLLQPAHSHSACTLCSRSLHLILPGCLTDLLTYTLSLLNKKVHFYSIVHALSGDSATAVYCGAYFSSVYTSLQIPVELIKGIFYPRLQNGCRSYVEVQYFLHLISTFNTNDGLLKTYAEELFILRRGWHDDTSSSRPDYSC